MTEHVVAMDPGGRSGWASARMSEDHFELTGGGVLRMDLAADWLAEQQGIGRFVDVVHTLSGTSRTLKYGRGKVYDTLVYETWKPRRDDYGRLDWLEGDDLVNAQHVGQLRWIARISGAKIVDQHPTDKPQAIKTMPQVLKDVDSYSNEQHDQDARMHLWLYFWRQWYTASVSPESTVIL